MLDITEQLRRYGEAIEREVLTASDAASTDHGRRSRRWGLVAVAAAFVAFVAAGVLLQPRSDGEQVDTTDTGSQPTVFGRRTGMVLLLPDGAQGVVAVDLDTSLAGFRSIEGERGGDQVVRLAVVDSSIVAGWDEVYATDMASGSGRKITDATVFLPGSESDDIWTMTWSGGRIGEGELSMRRMSLEGEVRAILQSFDDARYDAVGGVPSGLLVSGPDGVGVWDEWTQGIGQRLGPGPITAFSHNGEVLVWCTGGCESFERASLPVSGAPLPAQASPARQQIALSPDGGQVARLHRVDQESRLIVTDLDAGTERVVDASLAGGSVMWLSDRQLLYVAYTYGAGPTRAGLYDVDEQVWDQVDLPVSSAVGAVAVPRDVAGVLLPRPSSQVCRSAIGEDCRLPVSTVEGEGAGGIVEVSRSAVSDGTRIRARGRGFTAGAELYVSLCIRGRGEVGCDQARGARVVTDDDGDFSLSMFAYADILTYQGWMRCEPCELTARGVDQASSSRIEIEALDVLTRPEVRIETPGPYRPGQRVRLAGSGFQADSSDVLVGWCSFSTDDPETESDGTSASCAFSESGSGIVANADGEFVVEDFQMPTGSHAEACATKKCGLAWMPWEGSVPAYVTLFELRSP